MLWFMSRCPYKDILNNVIFAFKMSLLSERHLMTVVIHLTSYSIWAIFIYMYQYKHKQQYLHAFLFEKTTSQGHT